MGFKTVGMAKGEEILLGNEGGDSSVMAVICDGDGKKNVLTSAVLLGFENLMDLRDAVDARIVEILQVKRMSVSMLDADKEKKAIAAMNASIKRAERSVR